MRVGDALGLGLAGILATAPAAWAQQRPDPKADVSVAHPTWAADAGPLVAIDAAHHDFHTARGGYNPFARLLSKDGFRIGEVTGAITLDVLKPIDILVIANPLAASNVESWQLPTPSAFTPEEIAAIKAWVQRGGALLLIADHMPFAGAAGDLAAAFGVTFDNAFAIEGQGPETFSRANSRMHDSPLTQGLTSVQSFTGSAFKAPTATPVLTLDGRFQIIAPAVAWKFDDAPKRPATAADLRLATLEVGSGRVVVAGEAAMFTAQVAGPDGARRMGFNAERAEQNRPLILNVLHWLARRP
ncbi:MAG: hypothetical protein JWP92_2224 [Caulobacter sp.]|nr:hypothetical protein [Caulobacter sp.]